MQQNQVTGVIMTSSSDFFASLNLKNTHGITWLGNYGTRPCIAPSPPHAKTRTMIFVQGGPTSVPFSPFQKGCVGDFIPASSAEAAISNTLASSAGQSIPQANAARTDRTIIQATQPPACPLGVTVRDEHRLLSRGPTPVRPDRLAFYLKGYNNVTSDYLIHGFIHGFSIRYFGSLLAIRSPNLKSAMDNPTSVNDKLSKELTAGRIVGPFDTPPFETFRVSPLGIVPKKLPGEFRLIHHLSYPEGLSVNDGIPKELATVRYATIDDAVRLIKAIGRGCFLAKTDIKSAFRIIPVATRDFPLLCSRKSVTLKELQSLIGLLNFACCVVVPGRAFLRRLIDLTKGIRKPTHHVRLTKECKHDLNVWREFLSVYNGKSFFLGSRWATSQHLNLFTDAAGSLGYAAVFGKHWCFGEWPAAWKNFNITILELFPIVLAIEIWGPLMRDKCNVFFSDNQAVVEIINKQTSKDRSVMALLRHFVLCTLKYNILFHAKHIAGCVNRESDALSRLQVEKFRALAPYADEQPTPVPAGLLPNNWQIT